jgi:integrase
MRLLVGASHEELERVLGKLADNMLVKEGITSLDAPSRRKLLPELLKAIIQGMEVGSRKAGGDFSADPRAERFPEWHPPTVEAAAKPQGVVSLKGLVEAWWREAEAAGFSESTHASYAKAIAALGSFSKHDDATKITPEDIVAFKDHLAASPFQLSAKTIKDSYLAGLRSVFDWAVRNRKLPGNPAQGVTLKVAKRRKVRDTWFSSAEISAILGASSRTQRVAREPLQRFALRRWVPWLCAYTGARVGEIVQLRKEDVRKEDGVSIVSITPEAGTVKDKERRDIPLHKHLIDMGFVAFVQDADKGHLFMWSGSDRSAWRTAKNHLTRFVRAFVKDPHVQPNHAWRHTFKTIGSEAGVQDKVLDAICGHDPRTVGEGYGGVTLKAKARAIKMFPKYRC